MKIAIPTNNMIHVADELITAKMIRFFQVDKNAIVNEEYFDLKLINDRKLIVDYFKSFSVTAIVLKGIDKEVGKALNDNGINIVHSNEIIITNTITNYLKELNLRDSIFCCCP
ncbi:MAG: hypothetical protein HY951_09070 [Bacteroidia bacterium]|nr:hypothetical protein [Bacteroidia bacterium]